MADTHPALAPERGIAHVDFNIGSQGNRNEMEVSGKRKRVRLVHWSTCLFSAVNLRCTPTQN
jgi:hypothetical protein